ncbi:unnamed protein product [Sphenostylis stenocarpa]|uniref:Uncharacterized protein n=1 Tax=Sphenostylis stenocarpa TaxID=92480 RepID=A0AA86SGX2_9FABA|nr:unnamed protein product [Sphenostylis stenocarpa]
MDSRVCREKSNLLIRVVCEHKKIFNLFTSLHNYMKKQLTTYDEEKLEFAQKPNKAAPLRPLFDQKPGVVLVYSLSTAAHDPQSSNDSEDRFVE